MDNLNVKNINDEKIFSVVDPQGQGEVQDRIRPISVSINQDVKTVSDETESKVTISVYWNDTWKEILNLTFNDSLRKEYGKLVEDLTAIQKDVDMKQYKDAETKTNDMLKYLANLSNKYTQMSTNVDSIKSSANPFVTVTAKKDHFSVKVSERLLNFLLGKFEKVATLDYTKSDENFCINASRYNEDTIDLYYHSPALFETQGYMTVVKNFKTIGSYKATYDQFSKLASKLSFTPEKMGYAKDRFVGYTKTAEVVMQNIFFDTVDEAKEWQEMVDEKKKEEVAAEETNQEETTEKPGEMELPNGIQKGNSPVREDGGLARPDESFAGADELPDSEPQQQQQSGQGMAASRRVNNVKKIAKKLNKEALYGDVQEADIVPPNVETKVYLQSEEKEDGTIAIGDTVAIDADTFANEEEFIKYGKYAGVPMILIETDKENIDNVIVEMVDYPYERISIERVKVVPIGACMNEDIIVEDETGDEVIIPLSELPEIAASTKIKSIKKAAKLHK